MQFDWLKDKINVKFSKLIKMCMGKKLWLLAKFCQCLANYCFHELVLKEPELNSNNFETLILYIWFLSKYKWNLNLKTLRTNIWRHLFNQRVISKFINLSVLYSIYYLGHRMSSSCESWHFLWTKIWIQAGYVGHKFGQA